MISFNGFKMQDLGKKTQVIQRIFSGDDVSALEVKESECVKIMTGAMVPKGIETIIPIECMLESHTNFALAPKDFKLKPFKDQINAPLKLKGQRVHLILGNYLNNQFIPYNNNRYESGAIQALAQVDSTALIDEGVRLVQGEIEILRFEN
ncbi:hypothetical protein VN1276_08400 [Helicobacter pylori]|nr:hypothetical protein VN1276_08400 [Helicobacter pylori]